MVWTISIALCLMLSKAQNKYIRSLTQQKFRKEFNVFIAEGDKIAREWLISDAIVKIIVAESSWAETYKELINRHPQAELCIVNEAELEQITNLQTANKVLLVIEIPGENKKLPVDEWCIALDNIQDPGNLGTIIRIADWFGIKHVVCSPDCADYYNPKVIQAGMGSHLRVALHKTALEGFIAQYKMPVLAATLSGENITKTERLKAAVLLIGNESKGVSAELLKHVTKEITIPGKGGAESLNAAVSAGILCAMLTPS